MCKTPVVVVLERGLDENGAPILEDARALCCCWQQAERAVQGDVGSGTNRGRSGNGENRQGMELAATAYFAGDIAPALPLLTGRLVKGGQSWRIARAKRCCDPDGAVNYTRLELI
ncbi:MAG: hypothetical protein PHO10_03060 [Gemmiger sp.]|nr:hypothetical protein [Gemmiger sp.]